MDIDDKWAVRVGAIVLVLIVSAGGTIMTFDRFALSRTVAFDVHFAHITGLEAGASVVVAGREVGKIDSIALQPSGGVIARIKIRRRDRHRAAVNGEYFVSSRGFFSERYLEVGPPAGEKNPLRPVEAGDEIQGIAPPQMDRALNRMMAQLTITRLFMASVAPDARALGQRLTELSATLAATEPAPGRYDRLGRSIEALGDEMKSFGDALASGDINLTGAASTISRAREIVSAIEVRATTISAQLTTLDTDLDRVGALLPADVGVKVQYIQRQIGRSAAMIQRITTNIAELRAMVAGGEGTVGALLRDPEFSDDAKKLGKLLKRQPWRVLGHPGNKHPTYGKVPTPP